MNPAGKSSILPKVFLVPAILVVGCLTVLPILYNLYLSCFEKHAYLPVMRFVGIANYETTLHDAEFWSSFRNGAIYAISTIVLQVLVGVAAALVFNEKIRGRNLLRGTLLFPYLLPTVVVVLLWKWLLNASYGAVNWLLLRVGLIERPVVWFSQDMIMVTLVLVSVWQFFPFIFITVLARLQTIPEELYHAAKIDGASPFSRFVHITLPQLRNVLVVAILLRSIWMFTKFDTVWLLAGRDAVGKYIETIPIYAYRRTFTYLQAGMGAAAAVILLLVLCSGAVAYLRFTKHEVVSK